ncbi:unnamed protein product [Linum trigynum]|uniref:Exo_endo_phos domain-containing protein n=1 Tax=Linum trigynum TaxID=586398 RepID=A0AAV2CU90_9ROSI
METKQTKTENTETPNELGFTNCDSWPTDTSRGGRAGRLSVWWSEDVDLEFMYSSNHCIDMKITKEGGAIWRFTGVYGWPESNEKKNTWKLIGDLSNQWSGPWLCGGDFNEILSSEEKSGGQGRDERDMEAFRDCLADTDLKDLGFQGYCFTWENRWRNGGYIEERLDRFVASE